ncbi:MAG: hypothetical protein ABMA26_06810 [Limisphaerales bacterium]
MSTEITKSSYGYWVDAEANVHPVAQAEEHSGVAHRLLGAAFEQALALKWVRVSVYATSGLLSFEHDPKQPLSAAQMLALRELEHLHGLRLFDEVRQVPVEATRPKWTSRFPAT